MLWVKKSQLLSWLGLKVSPFPRQSVLPQLQCSKGCLPPNIFSRGYPSYSHWDWLVHLSEEHSTPGDERRHSSVTFSYARELLPGCLRRYDAANLPGGSTSIFSSPFQSVWKEGMWAPTSTITAESNASFHGGSQWQVAAVQGHLHDPIWSWDNITCLTRATNRSETTYINAQLIHSPFLQGPSTDFPLPTWETLEQQEHVFSLYIFLAQGLAHSRHGINYWINEWMNEIVLAVGCTPLAPPRSDIYNLIRDD